jgi:hypothetical protein
MPSYVPPSKRKEEKPTFDPTTLSNETLFPTLGGPVAQKIVKAGFKEVIEERLRKEAEEAIRRSQPVNLGALSIEEREELGYVTLKIEGNTKEEMLAIVKRMHGRVYVPEEFWFDKID